MNDMAIQNSYHHCGTCSCCGGRIPCGEKHIIRWTETGECPGHVDPDTGNCGAIRSVVERKHKKPGACHN